ncbi:MAG TPA: protein phosphatase 2C domain-containing protein [Verrucomicrobiae bacterium]
MNTSIALDSSRHLSEDRGDIIHLPDGVCIAIADGAGGISGGAEAADQVLQTVSSVIKSVSSDLGCASTLTSLDTVIWDDPRAGETTAIIVVVKPGSLFGASVGDSAAWLFTGESKQELTRGQRRKPFLGTGGVMPFTFSVEAPQGTLVVATDGLWKYTSIEAIHAVVKEHESTGLAHKLVDLVRLKSGALPDDICVITCSFP